MEDSNQNTFRPYRSPEQPQQSQSSLPRFMQQPQQSSQSVQPSQPKIQPQPRPSDNISHPNQSNHVHRKDIFMMSFFGFIAAGVVFLLLLFITGVLTGYVSFDVDMPGFSGEEEVIPEETPVIPAVETVTEIAPVVEEVVVEEEVLPCDQDISLVLNDGYRYGLKVITLKLVSDYSAQISVGGKSDFLDTGSTATINGLKITLIDSSEASTSAIIQVAC